MTREERLQYIARQLFDAKTQEKESTTQTKELRDEFFRLWEAGFDHKEYMLPVKTVEVPDKFFRSTGLSKEEFVSSRFPGWDVEHCEYNTVTETTVFVFKRNPKYVPGVVDVKDDDGIIRVSKEVSEYTPEFDWDTLMDERPDLYSRLAKRTIVVEIDEEEFERLVDENPEELATIQRHMKVREPVLRATAKRVKDGSE